MVPRQACAKPTMNKGVLDAPHNRASPLCDDYPPPRFLRGLWVSALQAPIKQLLFPCAVSTLCVWGCRLPPWASHSTCLTHAPLPGQAELMPETGQLSEGLRRVT